jgi:hypothetical protein
LADRNFSVLEDARPKIEILGPKVDGRPKAEIALGERNKCRESGNGVSRKMVRLEFKFLKEFGHKVTGWKAKAALKMLNEDDILTRLNDGRELTSREPDFHSIRDSPR